MRRERDTDIMREPVLAVRTIPASWTRAYNLTLTVVGGLHNIASNGKPYFTLTCDLHRKGHPDQCQSGGCDHETILKYYPRFADLAALHLCDIDGRPMYAMENGWYDLAGALPGAAGEKYHAGNSPRNFPKPAGAERKEEWDDTDYRNPTPDECLERFADHVRVDIGTAQRLRDKLVEVWRASRNNPEQPWKGNPPGLALFDSMNWGPDSWKWARQTFSAWIEEQAPRWKAEADACIAAHRLRVYGDLWPNPETSAE